MRDSSSKIRITWSKVEGVLALAHAGAFLHCMSSHSRCVLLHRCCSYYTVGCLLAPAHPKFNILLQMQTVVADVCGSGREYKLTLHVGDKKRMGSGGVERAIILLQNFLSMELTPPTAH